MNFEDVYSAFLIRQTKFNLSIQPAWPKQRWVQCVRSVGGHQDLDVAAGIKSIQLIGDRSNLNLLIETSHKSTSV